MVKSDKKLVINFFGSPGSGKTVAASSLFATLKKHHLDVELVSEFARDCILENNENAMANQLYLWATQQYRIFCGYRHAQIVVTDSPILLGAIYNQDASDALLDVIIEEHYKYNTLNIMMNLDLTRPYSMVGRVHSQAQSSGIHHEIENLLNEKDIPFVYYDEMTEEEIVDLIISSLN